jgi:hypothetical protein
MAAVVSREQIIRMARAAGCKPFRSPEHWDDVQVFATPDVLERFAALVSKHEREECADICEEEAETLMKISLQVDDHDGIVMEHANTCNHLATAIRARSQA